LDAISVSAKSISYREVDNVLFTADMKKLVCYTSRKPESSYIVPDSVTNMAAGAFNACKNLSSVTLPDSLTSIPDFAFYAYHNLFNYNS
jgi:hypothetical protein